MEEGDGRESLPSLTCFFSCLYQGNPHACSLTQLTIFGNICVNGRNQLILNLLSYGLFRTIIVTLCLKQYGRLQLVYDVWICKYVCDKCERK